MRGGEQSGSRGDRGLSHSKKKSRPSLVAVIRSFKNRGLIHFQKCNICFVFQSSFAKLKMKCHRLGGGATDQTPVRSKGQAAVPPAWYISHRPDRCIGPTDCSSGFRESTP